MKLKSKEARLDLETGLLSVLGGSSENICVLLLCNSQCPEGRSRPLAQAVSLCVLERGALL